MRAHGVCELRLLPECIQGVLPVDGPDPWSHGHLVHLHAKRVHGWGMANLAWGCWRCHLIGMHERGLKPNITRQEETTRNGLSANKG